jgi:hypothetical protein
LKDYIENEVTTDYNAGFQGALAGILSLGGDNGLPTTVKPTTRITTTAKSTTTTQNPNLKCFEINGLTLEEKTTWWGGGEYYVNGNFPDMSG